MTITFFQNATNMNHSQTLSQFAKVFADMKRKLLEWAAIKGGAVDTEGCMAGLSDNDAIHFNIRNAQLGCLAEYSAEVENLIAVLQFENEKLKSQVRLLETANRESIRGDDFVMAQIEKWLAFKIELDTTEYDFEFALRETVFYLELGIKRKILEPDERILKKINLSKLMLKDKFEFNFVFNNKKNKLFHGSIKTIIPTPVKP